MSSDTDMLLGKIKKLEENLDRAYREMADGVREFLDMREMLKSLTDEKDFLEEAAIKALTASSSMGQENAKKMLKEWYETTKQNHKIENKE